MTKGYFTRTGVQGRRIINNNNSKVYTQYERNRGDQ